MLISGKYSGFSLVEILVSLVVVSLAAANVFGLQKMVGEQNRNNVTHTAVIALATDKMEEVLKSASIDAVDLLNGKTDSVTLGLSETKFNYKWLIAGLGSEVGDSIREVTLQISWEDAKGDAQTFTYSEQVNLNLELKGGAAWEPTPPLDIIISLLETNDVIYFEPKMGYKKGSFVIYNSELYEATSVHSVGNGHPRDVADPNEDTGWKNYGPINNSELANNPDLATLFVD
ncbi:MAG: prepilin-type N-terminal cleavage/methylation domain-containing protein [Psychromonas sp.]|jgi:prepilin-type N-terminal cleavage/methylation domain-containing protein|uniref:type IV pilus modification PilV family protein n=1 Tax=Psychromonas sp. TaxID=1884585 RepID=UPI0039E5CA83